MWRGSLTFETPIRCFCIGFLCMFTWADSPACVVDRRGGHHAAQHLLRGRAFPLRVVPRRDLGPNCSGLFWLPKFTGKMYDETLGKGILLSAIAFNITFFLQHFLGLLACRAASRITRCNLPNGTPFPRSAHSMFGFEPVDLPVERGQDHPFRREGQGQTMEGADSVEWTHLPSPVPYHTFETVPNSNSTHRPIDGIGQERAPANPCRPRPST